jgi:predicted nucleic acid-binding protein
LNGDSMVRIRSKIRVLCDAGPIIHLDEIQCLHLMQDFHKVIVPDVVFREVIKHRPNAFGDTEIRWTMVSCNLPVKEPLQTMCRLFALDAGETAALAGMLEEPDLMFLTDDAAARIVASNLGFNVHGTIGILIRAVRRDLMKPEEVLGILNRLPLDSSLHIKNALLKEIISRVKREFNVL